ncbi:hypothetical protein VSS74_13255 [Conexibacter stalactiti]|uniref:ARB-07466-like C-terminal domain-containing protein n=1 Tax=Conexibacter stalactiti TaxID=1940611 RepID=A0ABU4HTC2_9ACTN|nr:hypothetical protein [Conexibacter stalactiti]MDW5595309.1 hypothetical protein [Conexibacter stalactiti]MEC5035951.1 hypothetical protein [Conexibacter stalactiti]
MTVAPPCHHHGPCGRRAARARLVLAAALLLLLTLPAAAHAWPAHYPAVAGNPANAGRIFQLPLEPSVYDPATRCSKRPKPGMTALVGWLESNVEGVSWGTYRCERWGKRSASLHAEGRAVDWHLDAASPADRREANRLIGLLLAPDKAGNPHALARRMGVEEIIWDCGYWGAGMEAHNRYSPCLTRTGKISRKVDKTTAHRDHIHIGLTLAGAAKRTSFWRAGPSY